ncbi:head-tail connector protein [Mycobacterium phage MyraDee]|uniref:Head-to-tail connector protein n=1 Tax=Mycobacterium phage MyraDee TaxID=2024303 RepID=A0A222YXU7_9CAUD|nr:head-tail connector protein [Mycobacterium phage MyraDee]ASR77122.1 head-to-tail connector protein [Mycobacterium phage MyraDee]
MLVKHSINGVVCEVDDEYGAELIASTYFTAYEAAAAPVKKTRKPRTAKPAEPAPAPEPAPEPEPVEDAPEDDEDEDEDEDTDDEE